MLTKRPLRLGTHTASAVSPEVTRSSSSSSGLSRGIALSSLTSAVPQISASQGNSIKRWGRPSSWHIRAAAAASLLAARWP